MSEEDRALKMRLEALVETVLTDDGDAQAQALRGLRDAVRAATTSMTAVPKPLRFLRRWYPRLARRAAHLLRDGTPAGAPAFAPGAEPPAAVASPAEAAFRVRRSLLCQLVSVLAMTSEEDASRRASLAWLLAARSYDAGAAAGGRPGGAKAAAALRAAAENAAPSSAEPPEDGVDPDAPDADGVPSGSFARWGHEYLRHLAGEMASEHEARAAEEAEGDGSAGAAGAVVGDKPSALASAWAAEGWTGEPWDAAKEAEDAAERKKKTADEAARAARLSREALQAVQAKARLKEAEDRAKGLGGVVRGKEAPRPPLGGGGRSGALGPVVEVVCAHHFTQHAEPEAVDLLLDTDASAATLARHACAAIDAADADEAAAGLRDEAALGPWPPAGAEPGEGGVAAPAAPSGPACAGWALAAPARGAEPGRWSGRVADASVAHASPATATLARDLAARRAAADASAARACLYLLQCSPYLEPAAGEKALRACAAVQRRHGRRVEALACALALDDLSLVEACVAEERCAATRRQMAHLLGRHGRTVDWEGLDETRGGAEGAVVRSLDALDVDDFRVDGACAAHAFRTSSAPLLEAPFGGPFWESLGGDPWGSFLGESPHAAAEHAAPLEYAHADYNCVCEKKRGGTF